MYDRTHNMYQSFVSYLEEVDTDGGTDADIAVELIDDILGSGVSDGESRGMIWAVVTATRLGELDDDARRELDKTRDWLADQ
jgi:hypothetical protein